jgi:hypothetical protein
MAEFVVYTGPSVRHDSRTRKMIRSRAMQDFRRRERDKNIRTFRDLVTDTEADTARAKKRGRQEDQPNEPKQRSHNAPVEMDQLHVDSSSTAHYRFLPGLNDTVRLPGPPVPSFYDSSTIFSSTLSSLDSSADFYNDVFGSTLPDIAWNPTALLDTFNPHAPNDADPLQRRTSQYSTVVTSRRQFSENHYTRGAAAFRSIQSHYVCESCLSQAATCSTCIESGSVGRPNTEESTMTVFDYQYTESWNLDEKPVYSMSTLFSRDPHEQMALQYFMNIVTKDLSGTVSVGLWEHLVPQMCQLEDTARQVAIALSQAHRERVTRTMSPQRNPLQSDFGSMQSAELALRANRALRKYIENSPSPSYELVLTCSIMFHTMESIFGRESNAVLHIENSLKMFNAWQRARRQAGRKGGDNAFHSLSMALARLDVSLSIGQGKRVPVFEDPLPETTSLEILMESLSFTNPHDAHFQLNRISTPACTFVMTNHQWRGKYAHSIPSRLVEEHRMLLKQYRAWDTAMSIYESDWLHGSRSKNRRAEAMSLTATRIVHWSAEKVIQEFIRADDGISPWDRSYPKILTYTSDLIDQIEQARLADGYLGHTSFSPEVAARGFLLMLAHRTALPHIRAEALTIAQRFGRKEGAFDLCGAFIEWTKLPVPRPPFPFLLGEPGH